MDPGDYLAALDDFMSPKNFYEFLARYPLSSWGSLDFEGFGPPKVYRLWVRYGEFRVNLHRIHSLDTQQEPLWHPHPWPGAFLILDGNYEMVVGSNQQEHLRVVLPQYSMYEMPKSVTWHSVRPLRGPVFSIMLTWDCHDEQLQHLKPLPESVREGMLEDFKQLGGAYLDR